MPNSTMGKALAITAVLCALVGFGLALADIVQGVKPQRRSAESEPVKASNYVPPHVALIADADAANSICRGMAGPDMQTACERRGELHAQLEELGWCYGEGAESSAEAVWAPCRSDEASILARRLDGPYKRDDWLRKRRADSSNFGNGVLVPLGLALAEFKVTNPSAQCVDSAEMGTLCDLQHPDALECPSEKTCTDVAYTFDDQGLYGFVAGFEDADWNAMRTATIERYGTPKHRRVALFSMVSDYWAWEFNAQTLTFARHRGTDVNGNRLRHPFSVILSRGEP